MRIATTTIMTFGRTTNYLNERLDAREVAQMLGAGVANENDNLTTNDN